MPKRAPPRCTLKVSPLRGSPVDDYIEARVTGWQADAVRELVKLVHRVAPAAKSVIKWAQPVFECNGPFAFIKPATAHVTLGFWRGADLADPHGLLEGEGERMRHVKLKNLGEVKKPALAAFVREAVKLNQRDGDPTRA